MTKLIEEGYLNEERFAVAFARGKFRMKSWGRNKIIQEMKRRGISEYCIGFAIGQIYGFIDRIVIPADLICHAAEQMQRVVVPLILRQNFSRNGFRFSEPTRAKMLDRNRKRRLNRNS